MSTTLTPNWQEIANDTRACYAKALKQHMESDKKLWITEREKAELDFALRTLQVKYNELEIKYNQLEAKCSQQKT